MGMGAAYHRARRQRPEIQEQRRTYRRAYERALARLRDEHRGRFAALLNDELDRSQPTTGEKGDG